MADPMAAYEVEVKRMHDTYGSDAEIPSPPKGYTGLRAGYPGTPNPRSKIVTRLEDLAGQVAAAGRELTEAREDFTRASLVREQAVQRFCAVTDALMQAIQEHREGTAENVPYPS